MLLEAARCLEEGVVPDADTLDLALCQTFWPPHKGGPLRYARELSATSLAELFQRLSQVHGQRFQLPPTLLKILTR
jgi:3-hydroxyacyl-CoA dehydrogenase/enoyl-CoA hydratase/3-hydroxybutyryl-CoA epimerase